MADDQLDTEKSTRFIALMSRYGWRRLLIRRWTTIGVLVFTTPFGVATAFGKLDSGELGIVGTAFLASAAALFGIVLAGLAVLGAFAGGQAFQTFLSDAQRRRDTYTEFYWVAAVAVASLVATSLLLLVATVTTNEVALFFACAVATAMFFEALFNSLWLVSAIVRLGLYGPQFARYAKQIEKPQPPDAPRGG